MSPKKSILIVLSLAIAILAFVKIQEGKGIGSLLGKNKSSNDFESKLDLESKSSQRNAGLEDGAMYLIQAFENGDEEELRKRVSELLEEDFDKALGIFSKLDYTFLHYKMTFPHDVVSEYLEKHYSGPEVMEILSQYINRSSILASVMGVYFENWMLRDHTEQFKWLEENNSFSDVRILAGYAEAMGQFPESKELLSSISQLSDDDVRRDDLLASAMNFVSGENPQVFADFLNGLDTLPKGVDIPLYNLAERVIKMEDPEFAMADAKKWIDLIEDEEVRQKYTEYIGSSYLYEHPEHFDKWFNTLDFESEEERHRVLSQIQAEAEFTSSLNSEESLKRRKELENSSPFIE